MDVKDLKGTIATPDVEVNVGVVSAQSGKTSAKSVSSGLSVAGNADSVKISLESSPETIERKVASESANKAITAINLAADATNEIAQLVSSVGGILEQVSKNEVAPQRKSILEKEANDLISEIKRQAATQTPDGTRPLYGDQIRIDVEEKVGKVLDVILPDEAKDAFGLGKIQFSQKDSIINTIVSVAQAKARVENLQKSVDDSRDKITELVNAVDVATQNSEASKSSVRDVDAALVLARDAKGLISTNPSQAIGSVGSLTQKVFDLLRS